jgi:transitional endoplasmic reticulum ATPase
MTQPPRFLDVRGVVEDELILNRDVEGVVKTNIHALLEHTDRVRQAGIPLKRGILLSGKYGVGKTMLSRIVAKKCITNGWTFVNVDSAKDLKEALLFAMRFQPAVVFCEDIDRHMAERDEAANELLNTVDGIISKNTEIMVVLTTNNAEKIEPAMLRPGRLDAVISVSPPDAESVQRLIKLYARGLLAEGETLDRVGEALKGNIPAVVREVVEKSKLSMIAYGRGNVLEEDLLNSFGGMTAHLALLGREMDQKTAGDRLYDALRETISGTGAGGGAEITDIAKVVATDGNNTRRTVKQEVGQATAAATQAGGAVSSVRQKLDKVGGTVDKIADEVGA